MTQRSSIPALLAERLAIPVAVAVAAWLLGVPIATVLLLALVGVVAALGLAWWAARRHAAPTEALNAELSRRVRELNALNQVSQRASSTLDSHEVMRGILDEMVAAFPRARKGLVHLLDEGGQTLVPFALSTVSSTVTKAMGLSVDQGIAGLVVRERRCIIIPDTSRDERFLDLGSNVRALMVAPLVAGPRTLGALSLDSEESGAFTEDMREVFQSLADRAAMALENARLYSESQKRVSELTQLYDSALALSGEQAPTTLQNRLVERAASLLDAASARLLCPDDGRTLRSDAAYPAEGATLPIPTLDERREPLAGHARDGSPLLAAPLLWKNEVIGVLELTRAPGETPFEQGELRLLTLFAQQAASLLQNAALIEELHLKQAELERANVELSRASQAKSEFLASMSHELRTPLNSILGFSEILIDQTFGELNARQRRYLETIHTSGQHLLDLINDILDLSKIEAGRMELDLEQFALAPALREVAATIEPLAARKRLDLRIDAAEAPERIGADRLRFKQVLFNILSNAVKFTPEGGSIELRAWGSGDGLHISITDSGRGIPEEQLEQIFDTFHQLDRAYNREAEGSGLGLALVRRFVELHGGEISVASRLGEGSTFEVRLPQPVRLEAGA